MRNALDAIAKLDGNIILNCSTSELLSLSGGGNLLGGIGVCDWSEAEPGLSEREIADALETIRLSDGDPVAIFISEPEAPLKSPLWSRLQAACLVIEEPVVTEATSKPVLTYLTSTSPLVRRRDHLLNQSTFLHYFDDAVVERSMDLREFCREFDRAVLLHVDPDTGLFSAEGATDEQKHARNNVMRPLRSVVERREENRLPELLRGVAARFPNGRQGGQVADEIARHTQKLLTSSLPHLPDGRAVQRRSGRRIGWSDNRTDVVLWTGLFLGFARRFYELDTEQPSSRLRTDTTLVILDQLGRDFLDRCASQTGHDPLSGMWSDLRAEICRARTDDGAIGTALGNLIRDLTSYLGRPTVGEKPWVARLRALLTDDSKCSANGRDALAADDSVPAHRPSGHPPRSFAEIVGHKAAIQGLRQRVKSNEHDTPVMLCGPDGAGKRTVGRIYANLILCEGDVNDGGSPCGYCDVCEQFKADSVFDLIELDAAASYADEYVQERLLNNLRYASLSGRRVVMIANPEKNPQVVERCLKTLEKRSEVNAFVFTATDVRAMSGAGQSRCEVYRLAPLNPDESKLLAHKFLASCPVPYDARVLDLIIAATDGLPRRILDLCNRSIGAGATTLDQARRALNFEWAEHIISYWRLLLSKHGPLDGELRLPAGVSARDELDRVRSILQEIRHVHETGATQHPALLHLDGEPVGQLVSMMASRASEMKLSFQSLWSSLSRCWLSEDHADPVGFLNAGIITRSIVEGQR
jgi:hypothetical protein